MYKNAYGFTIVELLIVIVVIGILAAITIVSFNGVQNRAYETTVKSDLASAAKQLEVVKAQLDRYPRALGEFVNFKFTKSAYSTTVNNALYCANKVTDEYAIGVTAKSGTRYLRTSKGLTEGVDVSPEAVCGAVGTTWSTPPSGSRIAMHGFFPTGASPSYINDWNSGWNWTN